LLLLSFCYFSLNGQQSISATGGNATGSGGTVTYTVGQVAWNMYSGTSGSILQGVQQPYEISVVTAVENTADIFPECTLYPNPTHGNIKLIVKSFSGRNLRFQLYDLNGVIIRDSKIESDVTEISLQDKSSSVYFLKVTGNKREIKVFKIIKN
jgi:hypothetical protein